MRREEEKKTKKICFSVAVKTENTVPKHFYDRVFFFYADKRASEKSLGPARLVRTSCTIFRDFNTRIYNCYTRDSKVERNNVRSTNYYLVYAA